MNTTEHGTNKGQVTKRIPNKLIEEKSPYLLQHAYNPVKWYPWGCEAFELAKKENKPIFLSIGYSTCHWCHVMEQESFEDEEVAALLNDNYVSIKVDKEERPDIDTIYMNVCQAFNGHGGWPLTIIMTPEQKPFFAGTYFPKNAKYNMFGLIDLLSSVKEQWTNEKEKLVNSSEEITKILTKSNVNKSNININYKYLLDKAYENFVDLFDSSNGGFGESPKFPTPHNLLFLLRYGFFEKNSEAVSMVEKTLIQMFRGGMYDHIGHGFSRYSTDKKWLVPHFEKMLYDNALLSFAYLEGYQLCKNELFKNVAVNTLDYVARELRHEDGGFFCAQDADSEGVEGKYYVFSKEEIITVLGEEDGQFICDYYDITEKGNFEGSNILNLLNNINYSHEDPKIAPLRVKLYQYRLERTKLHKDDKILTSWNSLMIVAYIKAYRVIYDEEYLHIARRSIDFILMNLTDENQDLYTSFRNQRGNHKGIIDDYSFFVWALTEFYEATFETTYLERALYFMKKMIHYFYDRNEGGFYIYGLNSEQLILRPKEVYDGAIPSGNSVACYCLNKLARITSDLEIQKIFEKQIDYLASEITGYPAGFCFTLLSMINEVYESKELICVVNDEKELESIKELFHKKYLLNTILLVKPDKEKNIIESLIPMLKSYNCKDNKATFYLCKNHVCSVAFHDIKELDNKL
jgi:uncharacterized protein YyaL (SSP411 family)